VVGRYLGEPAGGCVYVSATAPATALNALLYEGGVLALHEALIAGALYVVAQERRTHGCPSARELIIVLWNGDPERAQMAHDWRRVA